MATGFTDQDVVQTRIGQGNYSTSNYASGDTRFRFTAPYFSTQGGSSGLFYWDYTEIAVTLVVPDTVGGGNSAIYNYTASSSPGSQCYLDSVNNLLWIKPSFISSWTSSSTLDNYRFQIWYRPALKDSYNPTGVSTLDITGLATQIQTTTRIAQEAFEMARRSIQIPPEDESFTGVNVPDQKRMLPKISERANKYLTFGPGGEVLPVAASGTSTITVNYSGSSGGGSSSGEKNYVSNPDFETGYAYWSTTVDTTNTPATPTSTTPSSQAMASLTAAINQQTSLGVALAGYQDYVITKSSTSSVGRGDSLVTPIQLDKSVTIGPMKVVLNYKTSSAYAGVMSVFLWDVTNVQLVPLSTNALVGTNGAVGQFYASFFPTTSTSYKLFIMCTTSDTNTWTMNIDNVQVSPQTIPNAAAVGGWNTYTPSIVDSGGTSVISASPNVNVGYWRRVGSNMEVKFAYYHQTTVGTLGAAGNYRIKIPSGYTMDSSFTSGSGNSAVAVGVASGDLGGGTLTNFTLGAEPSFNGVRAGNLATGTQFASGGNFQMNTTYLSINGSFTVPIAQWTTNINLATDFTEYASNDGSGGIAANTNYSTGSVQGISGSTAPAINAVTVSAGQFTGYVVTFARPVQVADKIDVEIVTTAGTTQWYNSAVAWPWVVQGAARYGITWNYYSADTSGKSILVMFGNGGPANTSTYGLAGGVAWTGIKWRVRKVSNGNMAEVPPVVRADYYSADAAAVNVAINFSTKAEDTHSAVTTGAGVWKFTAPIAGMYSVKVNIQATSVNLYELRKGGATTTPIQSIIAYNSGAGTGQAVGTTDIRLVAGDYIDVRDITAANLVYATSRIQIVRIGT